MDTPSVCPSFCPNPVCHYHTPEAAACAGIAFFRPWGRYITSVAGVVRRYRCRACRRTFGERTFRFEYYTKRSLDHRAIFRAMTSGESLSAIARAQRCSVASVQNRLDRLSRGGLLLHHRLLSALALREDLCADGFESFDRSQYHPNAINLLVGVRSQFLYAVTHATVRRKGRMSEAQRLRRARIEALERPPRRGGERAFRSMLSIIPTVWRRSVLPRLELRSDEHPHYPAAIRTTPGLAEAIAERALVHRRYSARRARTLRNPLFPVNYYDRELRKDVAAYHRESVCFTRNVANGMARFVCHLVYHNYCKEHRIRWGRERTPLHAVVAGIPDQAVRDGVRRLFSDRWFPAHSPMPELWRKLWMRAYRTPLKRRPEYLPRFVREGVQQPLMNY